MLLIASNGRYVTAESGGGVNGDPARGPARDDALVADRTDADLEKYGTGWQNFTLVRNPDGNVALKLGQWFVTAERGGGSFVSTDRTTQDAWQHFQYVKVGAGGIAFRCIDGTHFLRVRTDKSRPVLDASGVNGDAATVFTIAGRKSRPVPSLVATGADLFDRDTGERVVLNGTDQFCALRRFIDGGSGALDELIDESLEFEFNMWRIFCQGSFAQNGILDLRPNLINGFYDFVTGLCGTLNESGIVPLLTVFVDNQDVRLGIDHWRRVNEAVSGTAFMSGGNQWPKNGFDPEALPPVSQPFWSRGSSLGDKNPLEKPVDSRHYIGLKGATFIEFHPRRDFPKGLDDSVASATDLRYVHGLNVPLIISEPARMGTDGSDAIYLVPHECWRFGRNYATMCAGAVFHSRAGQRSVLMDGPTRACAAAFQEGMQI